MEDQARQGMPTGDVLHISEHELMATLIDMPDRAERCAVALEVFATDVRREFATDDERQSVPDSPRLPAITARALMALALIAAEGLSPRMGVVVSCAPLTNKGGGGAWARDALICVVRQSDRGGLVRVQITVPSAEPERRGLPWRFQFREGRLVGVQSIDFRIRPDDEPEETTQDESEAEGGSGRGGSPWWPWWRRRSTSR